MRCNPWRWLWGLIPVLMLSWIAVHVHRPVVEDDLTARAKSIFDEAGFDWASVRFSGRDAVVSGRAPDESTPRKAIQAVRSVWGVRVVNAQTDLIERVRDYTWSASLRDERVLLTGTVQNSDARQSILRIVKTNFPNAKIEDDMRLARGGPAVAEWLARVGFGIRQLRYLKRGRVSLINEELRISGEAVDFTSYKTLGSHIAGTLPGGIKQARNEVTPPEMDPFRWRAQLSGRQLILDGYVPEESVRELLFQRAKAAFPQLAIVDRMQTARGAPRNWQRSVILALTQLARLQRGEAELIRRDLSFVGETTSEERSKEIADVLRRGLPETYKLVENITYPKPDYPVASPYVTTIGWENKGLVLSGSAPGPKLRAWLLQAIQSQFSDVPVQNGLGLATGQTEGWKACLNAGIPALAKFNTGRIQLVGRRLTLKASTPDEAVYNSVPGELRAAANRACDTEAIIDLQLPKEPNLTWRAVHSETSILLEGEVPSAETKLDLINAAGRIYSGLEVIDRMDVVSSDEGHWLSVAKLGLELLSKLRLGECVLHNRDLLVRGETNDTATATTVKSRLVREIAKGYAGRDRITVRSSAMIWAEQEAERRRKEAQRLANEEAQRLDAAEAERRKAEQEAQQQQQAAAEAERRRQKALEALRRRKAQEQQVREKAQAAAKACEDQLTSAATRGVILFDVSRATLKPQSKPTLDQLAGLVGKCDTGIVEISGHTDSDGSDDFNLELSQQRAEAVMRYLADEGVDRNRMRAIGYGESKPVVSNDDADGKAKNRRIEFKVMLE